jgi:carbon monoxide dehydrogenase subunit G
MDITGTYTLTAPPEKVWDLLMDPTIVAACIPGCGELEPIGEDRYRAKLAVALAAISGSYEGTVALSEKVKPASYRMEVEGQGKPGSVKGSAAIHLHPDAAGTRIEISGSVQTTGPIARLGQRLIGGVSKMMQDRFFANLQAKLSGT